MGPEPDSKDYVQYPLRITREFRDKLKASAQADNRTLMSEIMKRLEFSYKYDAWAEKHYNGPHLLGFNPEGFDPSPSVGEIEGPSFEEDLQYSIQALEHHGASRDQEIQDLNNRVESLEKHRERVERYLKAQPSWQDTEQGED